MGIDYQLDTLVKWKKIYYIYKGDKPPVLDKEKSKKKGDAPQSGERMMGFFAALQKHPSSISGDKKVRHRIRIRLGDLLYL